MRATLAELERLLAPAPDRTGRGSLMQGAPMVTPVKPTLGKRVHYVGKEGVHAKRAAFVTCTTAEFHGGTDLAPLSSDLHVHLHVLTPGPRGFFVEENIPFSESGEPGTWSWPTRF